MNWKSSSEPVTRSEKAVRTPDLWALYKQQRESQDQDKKVKKTYRTPKSTKKITNLRVKTPDGYEVKLQKVKLQQCFQQPKG